MDFFTWLSNNPLATNLAIFSVCAIVVATIILYVTAFIQGRSVSFWPPKIGEKPTHENSPDQESKRRKLRWISRDEQVSALQKKKREVLVRFYKTFVIEILDRTAIGINFCGAEPLRSVLIDYYCDVIRDKERKITKDDMKIINQKVRWFWYATDPVGFNYAPPIYESLEAQDEVQRPIDEVLASDAVIAFTGRGGTYGQLLRLYGYHKNDYEHGVNFEETPLVLLAWFGGTVAEFIGEHKGENSLKSILSKYTELLEPTKNLNDEDSDEHWYDSDMPEKLAKRLATAIKKLLQGKQTPHISLMCSTTEDIGPFE